MSMNMKERLKVHSKNKKQLRKAITHLERALNVAISKDENELIYVHTRTLLILWMAWLETTMGCILHSANQLLEEERKSIGCCKTEIDRWLSLLDICFKKYYLSKRKRVLNIINLSATNYYRYNELQSIIKENIAILIEIRNRLSHGQWSIALNYKGDQKNQNVTTHIWSLSKKEILLNKKLLTKFSSLMTELSCSKDSFEKKYDLCIQRIEEAKEYSEERYRWALSHIEKSAAVRRSLGF